MLLRSAKVLALLVLALVVLGVTSSLGPLSRLPQVVQVNETYIDLVRRHQLLLGLIAFSSVLIANMFVKVGFWPSVIVAWVAGTLFFVAIQAEDADFFSRFPEELSHFYVDYLFAGAVVVFAYICAAECLRRFKARDT